MKTIICMIVDESSSMRRKEDEVIEGYNCFLRDQLRIGDEARLHLVKFHRRVNVVYQNLPLESVPMLDNNSYQLQRGTALYDAIADGINSVALTKNCDERVIVVIITDGVDHSSKRYNEQQVKQLILRYKANGDWTFVYIGEYAQQFAARMGIPSRNAVDFCHEKGKIRANFEVASIAVTNLRSNKLKASDFLLNNK